MGPEVSALIPTYDRAGYVGGAVETVLRQTYPDVEAVVVVDGSTDGTREVLAKYADDDRVTVRSNGENRGIAYSFNRAAAAAAGDFYCILGDDDRWHPEKVERQVARFRTLPDEYGVVYTGGVLTSDGRITRRYVPRQRGDVYPEILRRFDLHPHSSHMIRREAFEDVGGFDPSFPQGVDWEMSIRLARAWKFDYLADCLVERTSHGDNVSGEDGRLRISRLVWEKHGDAIRAHPEVERVFRSNWAYNRAYVNLENGRRRAAIRHGWRAFRIRPTAFHGLVLVLALLGPAALGLAGGVRQRVSDARADCERPSRVAAPAGEEG